ncbi:type II toxin-antitoxin system HicB family antitoxin [Candidatus Pacearchaeota archaeon]|nr:type II toxin-antitoxin system HicB family antitoxin [Candidatus Pacearchaeota archaeon]
MKLTVDIHKGEKFFIARVPELGVTTQGKTRQEAKKNLKEAVQLHLESMVEYMIEKGNVKFSNNRVISLSK